MHIATFNAGRLLDETLLGDAGKHILNDPVTDIAVNDLATSEHHDDLYFVSFFKETKDVLQFEFKIMVIRAWAEFHFLQHDILLFCAGGMFPLSFHELVLAIVHDSANRRVRGGGNLHQIKPFVFGDPDRSRRGHDAKLCSIFVNDANLSGSNAIVDACLSRSDTVLPNRTRNLILPVKHGFTKRRSSNSQSDFFSNPLKKGFYRLNAQIALMAMAHGNGVCRRFPIS